MRDPVQLPKGAQNILRSLAVFDYLTADQVTRLCYAAASRTYVKALLKSLVDAQIVLSLGGRDVNLSLIYTLSSTGRQYAAVLGAATGKRVRPSEEQDKSHNPYFLKHTIAVTDVLIAAKLLSERVPAIQLSRMYTERELKRKIHVQLPGQTPEGKTRFHKICIEPDASCEFEITVTAEGTRHTGVDFFPYRSLPQSAACGRAL